MPDEAKAKAENTSEGDGKNTEGTATGAATQTAKTEDAPKFTQADLDRVAAKTRSEEQEKVRKAKEKDDLQAKEKQGEFERLYNELKPQHETQAARLTQYEEAVKSLAEGELKELPAEVRNMSPSIDDPLAVLAWLPQAKKLAEKLTGTVKRGNGGDPRPVGNGDPKADEKGRAGQAGIYRTF